MVKVRISRNVDGSVLTFFASGHADGPDWSFMSGTEEISSDDSVYDLVCAAISAIMQTALLGLGKYVGLEDRLTYNIDDDGWLYCRLPQELSPEERVRADAIIETMVIGLATIETDYPDKIMVEEEVE